MEKLAKSSGEINFYAFGKYSWAKAIFFGLRYS